MSTSPEQQSTPSPAKKQGRRRQNNNRKPKAKVASSPPKETESDTKPAGKKKPPHPKTKRGHTPPKASVAKGPSSSSYGPPPADMTVIVNRVKLWDEGGGRAETHLNENLEHRYQNQHLAVAPYHFAPDVSCWISTEIQAAASPNNTVVAVARASKIENITVRHDDGPGFDLMDTSIPNPHPPEVVLDKYWAQRRRLFSRFDMGVQLDSEGWFSVTPENIADHVAKRVGELSNSSAFRRGMPGSDITETEGIVVLDAFCGCGGNAIAFGKIPADQISLVVCVDIDRSKLRKAAYNASLYEIPTDKLVFIDCNTMFIMSQCYKDGELQIDKLRMGIPNMPESVPTELYAGYRIGGLNLLPRRIDAVFMDPPWGGVDYYRLKEGYDLEKHMRIKVGPGHVLPPPEPEVTAVGVADDFFDTFGTSAQPKTDPGLLFNASVNDGEYVNGVELVKMAAAATKSRLVIYDLPRNTTKTSLGEAALAAGYRGNMKLEEHYVNGRLKTVTAYMGADFSSLLLD